MSFFFNPDGDDKKPKKPKSTQRTPVSRSMVFSSQCDYDDTDDISLSDIMDLLLSIERSRQALRNDMATLQEWLADNSEFAKAYREFEGAGGVSADDFYKFVAGTFRVRRGIRKKRHLRLITSNKSLPRLKLRSRTRGDDDAA
jgi:hypothetical protein